MSFFAKKLLTYFFHYSIIYLYLNISAMTEIVACSAIYREPFVWWKRGNRVYVNNTLELAKERLFIGY